METIQGASSLGNIIDPLRQGNGIRKEDRKQKDEPYFFGFSDHHVTIHEDIRDALVDAFQDRSALDGMSVSLK
jgi:hypothetical protein